MSPVFLNGKQIVSKHESAITKLSEEQRKQPCDRCRHRRECHEGGRGMCNGNSYGGWACSCNRFRSKK